MRVSQMLDLGLLFGLFSSVSSGDNLTGQKRPSDEISGGSESSGPSKKHKTIYQHPSATKDCGHLEFLMIKPVNKRYPKQGEKCKSVCTDDENQFRIMSGWGFSGMYVPANEQKFDPRPANGRKGRSIKWLDVCQASGRICHGISLHLDVSSPWLDPPAYPTQALASKRIVSLSAETCSSSAAKEASSCAGSVPMLKCVCQIKLQLLNAYTGKKVHVPGDPNPLRSHDCRKAEICRRLELQFPNWICRKSTFLLPKACPRIGNSHSTGYAYGQTVEKSASFCPCNWYGKLGCRELYTETMATVEQAELNIQREPGEGPSEMMAQTQSAHPGLDSPYAFAHLGTLLETTVSQLQDALQDAYSQAAVEALQSQSSLDRYVRYQFIDQTWSNRQEVGEERDKTPQPSAPQADLDSHRPIQRLAQVRNHNFRSTITNLNTHLLQMMHDVRIMDQTALEEQIFGALDASDLYSWMFL